MGLPGEVVPPPVGGWVTVRWARNPFVARPEKGLQKNAHDQSLLCDGLADIHVYIVIDAVVDQWYEFFWLFVAIGDNPRHG